MGGQKTRVAECGGPNARKTGCRIRAISSAKTGIERTKKRLCRCVNPIQKVSHITRSARGKMAALRLANLVIAGYFDVATWAWFISVGAVGAKLAALAIQYAVFRTIVRRWLAQSAV